ncbi:hypothetical protein GLOIN_2v1784886 [Rhizophagus clarus]|uniref:Uncharacterized protein n=1 Tax=Rhizophagus clarus TaxID=94130 RepID=A0A8H3L5I6_9GLOM|nr:hypothetical protein GLOIN_2v1784886 [Rhizophagus clarus]
MACSKLFSGDLPELWCRLAIPLLWEDPFSKNYPKNYNFIEIYLQNLNDNDKTKLNEYVIEDDLFSSNTLFNYPSFIQHLDTFKVCHSVEKWFAAVRTSTTREQHSRFFIRDTNLTRTQISNITKLIYKLLLVTLIKNEVNLYSYEVTLLSRMEFEYFDEIFDLISENPNFIYNIKNFKLDFDEVTDNVKKFLEFLCSNCNSISSLYFLFPSYNYNNNYPIIEKSLSQIIQSQENLKKILLGFNAYCPLYNSLISLKYPNCSNTLNTIIFYYTNFKNITVLNEVFNELNVLESIHIVYCYSLDTKFIQQICNITKPFKLKSLFLHEKLQTESLELLIQKSGNYLENFGVTNSQSQQLLQLVIKYCSKIKYLGSIKLNNESIHLVLDLIRNITQNLNYLNINHIDYSDNKFSSIILRNLGQVLPVKLEYINLSLTIIIEDLEVFLINSQNSFIKKLLISNTKKEEVKSIFPCIKEHIMKKERVKYLAIIETFRGKNADLFSLKDMVREFQSHDIEILKYSDSFINIYDFIRETY